MNPAKRALHRLLVPLLLGSCAARGHDLANVEHVGSLTIHAESRLIAERIRQSIERTMPVVRELPGTIEREPGDVYVRSRFADGVSGFTHISWGFWSNEAYIDLWIQTGNPWLDPLVAHELTHYLVDPTWRRLPAIVEEGVCEIVAMQTDPMFASERRADHAIHLMTAFAGGVPMDIPVWSGGKISIVDGRGSKKGLDPSTVFDCERALRLSRDELLEVRPEENRQMLTSLGYFLASRIGIDALYALCRDAEKEDRDVVDPATLFAAAKLDPRTPEAWDAEILALVDDRGWRALALQIEPADLGETSPSSDRSDLRFFDASGNILGGTFVSRSGGRGGVPAGSTSFTIEPLGKPAPTPRP